MKKVLAILAMVLMFCGSAYADSIVTFEWDANTESDLGGYLLFQSQTSGVYPPDPIADIPAGTETMTIVNIPDGTYYWILKAYDLEGSRSAASNEVSSTLDTPISAPNSFIIKLIVNTQ